MAQAMLSHHDLPRNFWGEAAHTAVYIISHCPTKAVAKLTTKEVFTLQVTNPWCLTFACSDLMHMFISQIHKQTNVQEQEMLASWVLI